MFKQTPRDETGRLGRTARLLPEVLVLVSPAEMARKVALEIRRQKRRLLTSLMEINGDRSF